MASGNKNLTDAKKEMSLEDKKLLCAELLKKYIAQILDGRDYKFEKKLDEMVKAHGVMNLKERKIDESPKPENVFPLVFLGKIVMKSDNPILIFLKALFERTPDCSVTIVSNIESKAIPAISDYVTHWSPFFSVNRENGLNKLIENLKNELQKNLQIQRPRSDATGGNIL